MQDQLRTLSKQAKDKQKEHKTFFIKLRKKTPKKLDSVMEKLHKSEFEKTVCL